jgi:probable F420-dependent oxidoreductase
MQVSTNIRNWGDGSQPRTLIESARAAEAAGIGTVWVNDRLSTPTNRGWTPGDGGRYLDPLMALTFIASATETIRLGTGVLNAPYRLPVQLAKQVATLQDLSGGRLRLGVGVGWYETEFQVLGVPYAERGRRTDEALSLLHDAFANDVVRVNGAELPVLPRPARPPIYVGGQSGAALRRVIRFGDGWIAAGLGPDELAEPIARLTELADGADKAAPAIIAMKTLPLDDVKAAVDLAAAFAAAGVAELVHADGYPDASAYRRRVETLAERIIPAVASGA